jgi:HPt (histidine-containing phosphotransfer) domain-containing protein
MDNAAITPAVLDVEQGVERLMGNSRIYFNALKRFGSHIDAANGVAAQLAAGDHAGAHRTVHTLKGAAGLLGAGEVAALAVEVESAMVRGDTVNDLLSGLESALQRVQAKIEQVVREQAARDGESVAEPADVLPTNVDSARLLDELATLFDEGDGAAIDLLEQWEKVLEQAVGAGAWKAVAKAAHDYDFEAALLALNAARIAPDTGTAS